MKKTLFLLLVSLSAFSVAACRHTTPSKDRARITADHVEMKKSRATISTTVAQLSRGDEVDILARETRWLYVKNSHGERGWIEETAALSQAIVDDENKLQSETQPEVVQATGELTAATNLHIAPGRETPVYIRLPKGTRLQVYGRSLTDRPAPTSKNTPETSSPEGTSRKDAGLKIRSDQGQAGWVYSPSVNFSVPEEISEYSESRRIIAWLVLNQVETEDGKKVNQYVVADVASGILPEYDFDHIRVFTWNKKRSRYETAFRESRILGSYPIHVFTYENKPAFEFTCQSSAYSDSSKVTERYFMNGVLVRKITGESAPASRRVHSPRRSHK
jgi:hypothetical protein